MYEVKSRIFLGLTKTQKSSFCNYIKAFVKKNFGVSSEEILDKLIEDEMYYLEINASRFQFLAECFEDDKFISETLVFIKECVKYFSYKESQAPFIKAQKDYEKKKRKFLQEVKMSKESPTQKQLYYYEKLCKRYNKEMQSLDSLSKLDLRNKIDEILNEFKEDRETVDSSRD